MSFSLPDILFVIVIFQLLFTSGFLFTHRGGGKGGRRSSNILLGAFFLVLALNLTDNLLLDLGVYTGRAVYAFWSVWLLLLVGPLLYLYTQSVLYREFRWGWRKGVHFLPFVLFFLVTECFWLAIGEEARQQFLGRILLRRGADYQYWGSVLIFLPFFFYMAASFRLVGRFRKAAGDAFSNYRRTDIRWLSYTLLFFTVVMGLSAVNSLIGLTRLAPYWGLLFLLIAGAVWVYVNILLLKALRDPTLFSVLEEDKDGARGQEGRVEARAGAMQWGPVLLRLEGHMRGQRPWLEPDLTLEQLAGQLQMRPKLLSQAINEGLGQNFFEFVNTYRIEEAKRLLTDPADKKITVLEVLYEVGFNSKSSFNTVFKKQTGLTPSEFKKNNSS